MNLAVYDKNIAHEDLYGKAISNQVLHKRLGSSNIKSISMMGDVLSDKSWHHIMKVVEMISFALEGIELKGYMRRLLDGSGVFLEYVLGGEVLLWYGKAKKRINGLDLSNIVVDLNNGGFKGFKVLYIPITAIYLLDFDVVTSGSFTVEVGSSGEGLVLGFPEFTEGYFSFSSKYEKVLEKSVPGMSFRYQKSWKNANIDSRKFINAFTHMSEISGMYSTGAMIREGHDGNPELVDTCGNRLTRIPDKTVMEILWDLSDLPPFYSVRWDYGIVDHTFRREILYTESVEQGSYDLSITARRG